MAPAPVKGSIVTSLTGQAIFQPSQGAFSPGMPLAATDPQPVRILDFASGYNLQQRPRSYEAFGFPALRAFSNVEMVRLAIETRKDQVERFDWRVKKIGVRKSDPNDPGIKAATKFFSKPDGDLDFVTWLRAVLEDLLAIDAPAIERRRDRSGKLIGLDYVDGATIKILIDEQGRKPMPPLPRFQQIIKGRIWNDLTEDDLIYLPRNRRTHHLYGFSPVEQCIVTINTFLQRQTSQLAHFSSGTIPSGIINAPDTWTPDQLKSYQDWMDSRLSGNLEEKAKLLWVPNGAKYQAFKEAPIKDEFDEWLARIVAYAFSLPPTPFIRQMNKGTAGEDQSRALEEGLKPILNWCTRLFTGILQDDLGYTDLEFVWETPTDTDTATQSIINDRDVKNGSRTINEVRDSIGLDPSDDPSADTLMVWTTNGYVPLDAYAQQQAQQQAQQEQARQDAKDAAALAAQAPPGNDANGAKPDANLPKPDEAQPPKKEVGKLVDAPFWRTATRSTKPVFPDSPTTLRATKRLKRALAAGLSDLADDVARQLRKALAGVAKADGETDASKQKLAEDVANGIDLLALIKIVPATEKQLASVAQDAVKRTVDEIADAAPDALAGEHKAINPLPSATATANAEDVARQLRKALAGDLAGGKGPATGEAEASGAEAGGASTAATATAEAGGERAAAQVGVDAAGDLVNQVNDLAVAWARERAAELVGMKYNAEGDLVESANASMRIDETTREMLRATIADGLQDNIGLDGIIDNVVDSYAFSEDRATLIATTEVANANSQSSLITAKNVAALNMNNASAPGIKKIWITAGDDRVDDLCVINNLQGPIDLDAIFLSGDTAPLAHPRCRCAISYTFPSKG